jgi:quercetin dioxygenase-like cupin family protein
MTKSVFDRLRPQMQDVLGPLVAFGTPSAHESDFSVLQALLPAGTSVPLHSHADREFIVVVEGSLSIWVGGFWRNVQAGGSVDIRPDERHSLLNNSGSEVAVILVTTPVMRKFMESVGIPAVNSKGPPTSARIEQFVEQARAHGYWLGSPEEQAALGLPR